MSIRCELKQAACDIERKCETYTLKSFIYFLMILLSTMTLQHYGFRSILNTISIICYTIIFIAAIFWLRTVRARCNSRKNKGI